MLTFPEEILALLLHEEDGSFLQVGKSTMDCALAGAALIELAFANRIDTDSEQLKVIDPKPLDNPLLDSVLKRIADSDEVHDTKTWIETLSAEEGMNLRERALASLIERGIVERKEEKILWVFRADRYETVDNEPEREAKKRIANVLFSDEIPHPRDIALICLTDACGILRTVFEDRELKRITPRIKQLRKLDLIGAEMARAIIDIERSVMLLMAHPL